MNAIAVPLIRFGRPRTKPGLYAVVGIEVGLFIAFCTLISALGLT